MLLCRKRTVKIIKANFLTKGSDAIFTCSLNLFPMLPKGVAHLCNGASNNFRLRATLGFYVCFEGQIHVKYAILKLKMKHFAGWMWPKWKFVAPT